MAILELLQVDSGNIINRQVVDLELRFPQHFESCQSELYFLRYCRNTTAYRMGRVVPRSRTRPRALGMRPGVGYFVGTGRGTRPRFAGKRPRARVALGNFSGRDRPSGKALRDASLRLGDATWRPVPSLFVIYVLLTTELAKVVNIKVVALEVSFPMPLGFYHFVLRSSRYDHNTKDYLLKGLYHFISSKITLNCYFSPNHT